VVVHTLLGFKHYLLGGRAPRQDCCWSDFDLRTDITWLKTKRHLCKMYICCLQICKMCTQRVCKSIHQGAHPNQRPPTHCASAQVLTRRKCKSRPRLGPARMYVRCYQL
jgi:hypothetical protein